ncbi:MAG TPA: hypothetical protein VM791_09990 [Vicinamibacterales bacterium]|jgi:hypothetical protein|nr:hypothetical protein [Vicinamibacterales bacterium]
MNTCTIHDAGSVDLYFYGELAPAEHAVVAEHLRQCRLCRTALEELTVIREALAACPDITAPPTGDWSAFMNRLDTAVRVAVPASVVVSLDSRRPSVVRRPVLNLLATAALLALVVASVFLASRARQQLVQPQNNDQARVADATPTDLEPTQSGLASVSAGHLERSKLVVLGLATRQPDDVKRSDWAYERELATSLLNDTRLYRIAAEQRGLTSLAGVMRDLELVLLQTSMADDTDAAALPRIQRLIRKRGLVEKMDVARTTGLVP